LGTIQGCLTFLLKEKPVNLVSYILRKLQKAEFSQSDLTEAAEEVEVIVIAEDQYFKAPNT